MEATPERELHIRPPLIVINAAAAALGMLALFLLIQTISSLKEYRFIGSGVTATNQITVSGMGEVFAVPDRAEFSVSVHEEGEVVADAQEKATEKMNAIIDYLEDEGVEEKDIKTTSYSVNPKYIWDQQACREGYCPPGRQTLDGFEVYQTISVKVADTKKAGELLSGVGGLGASDVSGLSFTVEDEDALKAEARRLAIAEAQEKAEVLADELDVDVVRIVGFQEDSGGYPPPYYSYGKGGMAMDMAVAERSVAPELPTGENKIVSNVSITYEIR